MALKNFAEKVPVTIFDDELIVGRPNAWLGRWAIVYPELDGAIMPAGVEEFKKNKGKIGEVVVTEDDEKIIDETSHLIGLVATTRRRFMMPFLKKRDF